MLVRNSIWLILNFVALAHGMTSTAQKRHRNFRLLPQAPRCSNPIDNMKTRIVGGEDSKIGQFPWIARIGYVLTNCFGYDKRPVFDCGSSLITATAVLTAAHCVVVPDMKGYCPRTGKSEPVKVGYVKLGEWDGSNDNIDCMGYVCADTAQLIKVKKTVTHRSYRDSGTDYDISLIILKTPAKITEWVNPICLPMGALLSKKSTGQIGEVAGWGYIDNDQNNQGVLKFVRIPMLDISACESFWSDLGYVSVGVLCAGGKKGEDSCNGDSGGPLMLNGRLNGYLKPYLTGLVSFGAAMCGSAGEPAVYTSVSYYMKWILDKLK